MDEQEKFRRTADPREFLCSPVWSYGLLLAVVVLFGLIRIRVLHLPLERDEGEYAYGGALILRGIAPYRLCYTMKLPGTAAAYALIEAAFGRSSGGIHLGLLLVNSATIVLMYFLGKRLFGSLGGVVACASLALLSLEPAVLGFSAHATQFVVLPAVAGTLILLQAIDSQRPALFFWSGILLGLAMLMKQPGAFFVLFGVVYVVQSGVMQAGWERRPGEERIAWKRLGWQEGALLVGAILPFALTCLVLLRMGVFRKFWFWTFSYAREYEGMVSLSDGVQALWSVGLSVVGAAFLIWLVAALSPVLLSRDSKSRPHIGFLASFVLFSCAAVSLGFHFRNHYFVLVLPAVALLCAGGVSAGTNLLLRSELTRRWAFVPVVIYLLCFVFSLAQERQLFFVEDPARLSRTIFAENPFPEALVISDFIKNHSRPNDRVAVIGSEPEIYFYSDRLSATGYIYMYPLMEPQPFASTMQKEMISEIEAAQPRFLVLVDSQVSWVRQPKSDTTIFEWLAQYVQAGYDLAGIADILPGGTEFHWADAAAYRPRSRNKVFVYDREQENHPVIEQRK